MIEVCSCSDVFCKYSSILTGAECRFDVEHPREIDLLVGIEIDEKTYLVCDYTHSLLDVACCLGKLHKVGCFKYSSVKGEKGPSHLPKQTSVQDLAARDIALPKHVATFSTEEVSKAAAWSNARKVAEILNKDQQLLTY